RAGHGRLHLGGERPPHDGDLRRRRWHAVNPAVVLQASGPNALGIVRSLGRVGVPVVACDHDAQALGLRSRYARPHVMADPLADPETFVDDLVALGRALPARGVLYATHDEALSAIGPREERLRPWFHRPWSPWATLAGVLDKRRQQAAAREIGFPVPASVEPGDEGDVVAAARELRVPLGVNPRNAPEVRPRFHVLLLEA